MSSNHDNYQKTRMSIMNRHLSRRLGDDIELQANMYQGNQKMNCKIKLFL